MKVSKAFDGEVMKTINGVKAQKIFDDPRLKVMHLTLNPGAKLETHSTPVDVFFYILEGEAWIEIGDERERADKDSVVESPKNIPHGIENYNKDKVLRVMVVKIL
ncbi:MAG: cupin domain-containing protein [Spirochaetaceae bacterium]